MNYISTRLRDYISIFRLHHWIKNLLVFAPLLFSLRLLHVPSLIRSILSFIAFCLVSSSIYIVNDVLDRERDSKHPIKKRRAIARGAVPIGKALFISVLLALVGIGLSLCIGPGVCLILISYMIMNLIYSSLIKNIVILDVMIIAFGFVMRVLLGTVAIHATFSNWIMLTTFFLSLVLGFGKRRQEIVYNHINGDQLPVLALYNVLLLDFLIIISITVTIMSYSLYVIDAKTMGKFGTNHLIYTIPVVVYGLFQYLYLIVKKRITGDPAEVMFHEKSISITVGIWIVAVICVLYL